MYSYKIRSIDCSSKELNATEKDMMLIEQSRGLVKYLAPIYVAVVSLSKHIQHTRTPLQRIPINPLLFIYPKRFCERIKILSEDKK